MDKFLKRKTDTCNAGTQQDSAPGTSNVIKVKKQKLVKRKYREDYIQYGFSWCGNEDAPKRSVLFVGRNLQMKQWFLINLCAT